MIRQSVTMYNVAAMLLAAVLLSGCGGSSEPQAKAPPPDTAGPPKPPAPNVGGAQNDASSQEEDPFANTSPLPQNVPSSKYVAPTKPVDSNEDVKPKAIELGEWASLSGFAPYQIRPPLGFKASSQKDTENPNATVFLWQGELYDLSGTMAAAPRLEVVIWEDSTGTSAAQEINRKLISLSKGKSHWTCGNITPMIINGISFFQCSFDFGDDYGTGKGFLYAAVDGNKVVLMSSAIYAVGDYDNLVTIRASARTFQKGTP